MQRSFTSLHSSFIQEDLEAFLHRQCRVSLEAFRKVTRHYGLFQIAFFAAFFLEVLALLIFFSTLAQSSFLAFSLALIFLTGFAYFVLLFYFQAKKPDQFFHLCQHYLKACRQEIDWEKDSSQYHLAISHAIYRFVDYLQDQEYTYYIPSREFETLTPLFQKLSCWIHWKDLHKMKEILLFIPIQEHIHWIKREPTDVTAHFALAIAYLNLARLYLPPPQKTPPLWIPREYFSASMHEQFEKSALRAIEEFRIVEDYSPDDTWAYLHLASIYHDLEMPEQEILEYEKILKHSPHDPHILFTLGVLYFKQGHNAKGLRMYEELTRLNDPKLEELIAHYDDFFAADYIFEVT